MRPSRNGRRRPKRERERSLQLPISGPFTPSQSFASENSTPTIAGESSSTSVANLRK